MANGFSKQKSVNMIILGKICLNSKNEIIDWQPIKPATRLNKDRSIALSG